MLAGNNKIMRARQTSRQFYLIILAYFKNTFIAAAYNYIYAAKFQQRLNTIISHYFITVIYG